MQCRLVLAGRAQGHAAPSLGKEAIAGLIQGVIGTHLGAKIGIIGCSKFVLVLNQAGKCGIHVGKRHLQLVASVGIVGGMGNHRQQPFVCRTDEALPPQLAVNMACIHLPMRICRCG